MTDVTAIRKIIQPFFEGGEWSLGTIQNGLISYSNGNLAVRLEGDFTAFEFIGSGTISEVTIVQNGNDQFTVEGLALGNGGWATFETGLNTGLFTAMGTILDTGDTFQGGDKTDLIYAQAGRDTAFGAVGNDEIYGGDGQDKLYGGRGNDEIDGDLGNDRIWGGKGNDILDGDDGNDRLYGGRGNDFIEGDEDDDILFGGRGADTFNFDFGDGDNVVKDFGRGADMLEFELFGFIEGYTSRDFVNEFTRKAGGDTFIEAEGFSVVLEDFTTTKAGLAEIVDLEIFNLF